MGGGGSSGPTVQQEQLQTQQALTTANLNLEENSQRKVILNAMQGTRAFRGSALSRNIAGNNDAPAAAGAAPAPSADQAINTYGQITTTPTASLLDQAARGQSSAGGAGASGNATAGRGAAVGGGALK
jgi:hypothetical protein